LTVVRKLRSITCRFLPMIAGLDRGLVVLRLEFHADAVVGAEGRDDLLARARQRQVFWRPT